MTLKKRELESIIESLPQILIYLDNNFNILYVNHAFTKAFLYSKSEVINKQIDFISQGFQKISDFIQEQEINPQKKFIKPDLNFKSKNNEILKGKVYISRIDASFDKQSEEKFLLIIKLQDTSQSCDTNTPAIKSKAAESSPAEIQLKEALAEADRAREEAENARREAESSNLSKSEFLANISHEIRTPLNAVMGFSQLLLDEQLPPHVTANLKIIKDSGFHLMMLINDLLDLSKIEAGRMEISESELDIIKLTKEVRKIVSPRLKSKVKLSFYFDDNIPEKLLGDYAHIKQILLNLLSNAIKFTSEGKVTLTIEKDEDQEETAQVFPLKISVADTGIGITEEKLEAVFDPFDRGSKSISREYEGTGLGLSITKMLTHLMGGTISVQSRLGKGSVFTICLPLKKSSIETKIFLQQGQNALDMSSQRPSLYSKQVTKTRKTKIHILLVEDNIINQKLVKAYLKNRNYKIDIADNGLEALEKARSNNYDLIIMDIQLPGIDGLEATRRVRGLEQHKETPIIALTAYAMKGDAQKSINAGCNSYLSKPVTPEVLLETINLHLSGKCLPEIKNLNHINLSSEIQCLLPQFINQMRNNQRLLWEAIKYKNIESISKIGHQMHGNGAVFGYKEISQIGSRLEEASRAGNWSKIEEIFEEFNKIMLNIP